MSTGGEDVQTVVRESAVARGGLKQEIFKDVSRKHHETQLKLLYKVKVKKQIGDNLVTVTFNDKGVKYLLSDAFGSGDHFKVQDLSDLVGLLERSTFVTSAPALGRKDFVKFHYFKTELRGKDVYLNVGEVRHKGKQKGRYLYSVSPTLQSDK